MDFQLLLQQTSRKIRTLGIRGTLLRAFRELFEAVGFFGTNGFDLRCGTDTGGTVPLWTLDLDSPNALFGTKYAASEEEEVRDAVRFLAEDPRGLVFVDVGCGKGRVLLVAAKLGFKQVIGVEFARELTEIAKQNFAKMNVTNAAVVHADAADYQFPDCDMVVYLFNPFLPQVMKKVVANLKESRAKRLFVIYNVPNCGSLFDDSGFLTRIGSPPARPHMQIWKAVRASA